MADGVNTAVDAVKMASRVALTHSIRAPPGRAELGEGDDAVLPCGQLGNPPADPRREQQNVR